jgi:hypothetical protein
VTQKYDDWLAEAKLPPESIRLRWLERLEALRLDWRTEVELAPHELRFRREIVRWIMSSHGACRSLPSGYVLHCWPNLKNEARIVLMRTR